MTRAQAWARARPGQALLGGLGSGLENPKPRPAQARQMMVVPALPSNIVLPPWPLTQCISTSRAGSRAVRERLRAASGFDGQLLMGRHPNKIAINKHMFTRDLSTAGSSAET
jgi:hypothetical protein